MVLPSFSPGEARPSYSRQSGILQAELIFGITSKRCSGNGICTLYTKGSIQLERAYSNFAEVDIECDQQEYLLFGIKKNTMRQRTKLKFFSTPSFVMEEDFILPSFVTDYFSIERKILSKGNYTYYEFKNKYFILFPNQY
ncbi:MAG: hypothetical protein AAF705_03670 [Bacteroidota bacterium]